MRVVVDTNVVVSSFLVPAGPPVEVMRRARATRFEIVVSSAVLAEYERVLGYPHLRPLHGLDEAGITAAVDELRDFALVVAPTMRLWVVEGDESDNRFLECAVEGGVAVIVSGDKHLVALGSYEGIRIVRPAAFVAELDAGAGAGG